MFFKVFLLLLFCFLRQQKMETVGAGGGVEKAGGDEEGF